jgi:NADH:ubiquinone oxidoreductase subunit 3 (subunit A)
MGHGRMMHPYVLVGLFLGVAVLIGAAPPVFARLLGGRKRGGKRGNAPDCRDEWARPSTQVGAFVVVGIVFGTAVVLFVPWAVASADLPLEAVLGALPMALLVGLALAYVQRKGWLTWR